MVLTQSCDLVTRVGTLPSSRYITIAAVRPLSLALERELDKRGTTIEINGDSYRNVKAQGAAEQFLEKLFNNNNTDYFFLKADPESGLDEDSCCFLHLSIALRSETHFETCLNAKAIELDGVFQSKLGWLVGNLYSRVGTPDWVPDTLPKEEFSALIKETVKSNSLWIPQDVFPQFQKTAGNSPRSDFDEIYQSVKAQKKQANAQNITKIAELIATKCELSPEQQDQLTTALTSDQALRKSLKLQQ